MDRILLGAVLLAIPVIVLLYLSYRIVAAASKLFHSGRIFESLGLLGIAIVGASLVGKFGNEKTILVVALLSWIFLAAAFIRFVLHHGEAEPKRRPRFADTQSDQDPNAMNFSGVGPGFQGFGIYAGGVRIAHDPLDDD